MADNRITPAQFVEAFRDLVSQATGTSESEPTLVNHLKRHFEQDPARLPLVSEGFKISDHPNLHVALENYFAPDDRPTTLIGFMSNRDRYGGARFVDLLQTGGDAATDGPVQYRNVEIEEGNIISCVNKGVYLVRDGEHRLAIMVRGPEGDYRPKLELDVMSTDRTIAEKFLAELRASMRQRNVYRGKILSLTQDCYQNTTISVKKLPSIDRTQIILTQGLLDRIERSTIQFARHAEKLKNAGRHLKRGILLYGPPGTGKTLSAMYLSAQMPGRTVLIVTGSGMGVIAEVCAMARALQPATVVIEDVDLIAKHRSEQTTNTNAVLFELLNEMDGLAEDADILFLLTTNAPDELEDALASRPGRVDMAIEVPLPDAESRLRLMELYGRGLKLDVADFSRFVARTEGVSASFIRELMRKATLIAADASEEMVVRESHLDEALNELILEGNPLTRRLLGFSKTGDGD